MEAVYDGKLKIRVSIYFLIFSPTNNKRIFTVDEKDVNGGQNEKLNATPPRKDVPVPVRDGSS